VPTRISNGAHRRSTLSTATLSGTSPHRSTRLHPKYPTYHYYPTNLTQSHSFLRVCSRLHLVCLIQGWESLKAPDEDRHSAPALGEGIEVVAVQKPDAVVSDDADQPAFRLQSRKHRDADFTIVAAGSASVCLSALHALEAAMVDTLYANPECAQPAVCADILRLEAFGPRVPPDVDTSSESSTTSPSRSAHDLMGGFSFEALSAESSWSSVSKSETVWTSKSEPPTQLNPPNAKIKVKTVPTRWPINRANRTAVASPSSPLRPKEVRVSPSALQLGGRPSKCIVSSPGLSVSTTRHNVPSHIEQARRNKSTIVDAGNTSTVECTSMCTLPVGSVRPVGLAETWDGPTRGETGVCNVPLAAVSDSKGAHSQSNSDLGSVAASNNTVKRSKRTSSRMATPPWRLSLQREQAARKEYAQRNPHAKLGMTNCASTSSRRD
jgi:hypothetical protein